MKNIFIRQAKLPKDAYRLDLTRVLGDYHKKYMEEKLKERRTNDKTSSR